MLRSIKQLCGARLRATNGEIGHVNDFYFDDQNWVVRYVVVDTGSWLPGRQVLISPHAFGNLHEIEGTSRVHLTRKQIEDSPSIELRKPVSRQFEEEYYRHYGWPCYWLGGGLWGLSVRPIREAPAGAPSNMPTAAIAPQTGGAEAHLRSALAVNGYQLKASDGIIGHVCDFMMDPDSWAIRQLVVKTGHRLTGREVLTPTRNVERISYLDSTVYMNLSGQAVELGPVHDPSQVSASA